MASLGEHLLRRLRRRPAPPPTSRDHRPPVVPAVDDLVAALRAGRLHAFAMLLLSTARSGDAELVGSAERLLTGAGPRVWRALDAATRSHWGSTPRWTRETVELLAQGPPARLALVLAGCHPDGHVREAAVARVGELPDALFAPVLALRAADWVPQVRDRARLACRHRLAAPAALPELGRVAFTLEEREGGRWLADELRALLRDGPREFLLAGLTAPDHRTRRIAHQAGRETGRLGPRRLLEAALRDPDLPTRVACADEVIRRARDAGDLGPVRRLRASRTAAIRAAAVHTLALAGDREPSALLDRSPLVRATAQAAERRAGTDPATRYRAALADRPTAVAGLGETGTAADRALLRPLLADPTARVRFEAVRALRRLGDESDLAYLLTDPSPAVVRQVVTHQRPRAATLDESLLRDLLAPTHPAHVRRAAVLLLREHDPWCRLAHDLRLVDDQDVELRGHARTDIGSWLSTAATTYSQPNPARRAELLDLLTRAAPVLDPRTTTALRFHIG